MFSLQIDRIFSHIGSLTTFSGMFCSGWPGQTPAILFRGRVFVFICMDRFGRNLLANREMKGGFIVMIRLLRVTRKWIEIHHKINMRTKR